MAGTAQTDTGEIIEIADKMLVDQKTLVIASDGRVFSPHPDRGLVLVEIDPESIDGLPKALDAAGEVEATVAEEAAQAEASYDGGEAQPTPEEVQAAAAEAASEASEGDELTPGASNPEDEAAAEAAADEAASDDED